MLTHSSIRMHNDIICSFSLIDLTYFTNNASAKNKKMELKFKMEKKKKGNLYIFVFNLH